MNGQKVWTSNADTAAFGILLARTDVDAPKHRGITYFLLDMTTPGIDIRPLKQMTGDSHFSEVFLTDVAIPVSSVLGGEAGIGHGWPAAVHTLANERAMIGGNSLMVDLDDLVALARERGLIDDPNVRQQLAATHIRGEVLTYLGYRARTAMAQGRPPGPETSVVKLSMADHLARSGSLAKALEGAAGMLDGGVLEGPGSPPGHGQAAERGCGRGGSCTPRRSASPAAPTRSSAGSSASGSSGCPTIPGPTPSSPARPRPPAHPGPALAPVAPSSVLTRWPRPLIPRPATPPSPAAPWVPTQGPTVGATSSRAARRPGGNG